MRIAVVYSLPTDRLLSTSFAKADEDTADTAHDVYAALKRLGLSPFLVPIGEENIANIGKVSADCIFNLIEWTGLDAQLAVEAAKLLDQTGIPYTGAGFDGYTLTLDKIKMKEAFDQFHLSTPRWQEFIAGSEPARADFTYPLIVKLTLEHASVGMTRDAIVANEEELKKSVLDRIARFEQPVYAEEFIQGREIHTTVLEKQGKPVMLPAAEIHFKNDTPFLTYEGKWFSDHPDFNNWQGLPAELSPELKKKLEIVSLAAFTKLEFSDYGRFDFRVRGGEVFLLEANANASLGDYEEYPLTIAFRQAGMSFDMFVGAIVASCLARFNARLEQRQMRKIRKILADLPVAWPQ